MDIEREAFEKLPEINQWIDALMYGEKTGVYIAIDSKKHEGVANWINGAWFMWQAKAKAVPDAYTPIVLALENVQSKVAKTSFLTMDEENEKEIMAVDANELAAYIDALIKEKEPK